MAWYNDVLRGFGLAGTGFVAGSAAGGPVGGLLGGVYGATKAGLGGASEGGSAYFRNVYQTALPTAGAGLLLYPSAQKAFLKQEAYDFNKQFSSVGALQTPQSAGLMGLQLAELKGQIAGLGGAGIAGTGAVLGGASNIFGAAWKGGGNLLTGLGKGLETLYTGQAPNALAALWAQGRQAAGGISAPSLTSILGGGGPTPASAPAFIPIPTPGESREPILAGLPPVTMILLIGAGLFLFFKKGAIR